MREREHWRLFFLLSFFFFFHHSLPQPNSLEPARVVELAVAAEGGVAACLREHCCASLFFCSFAAVVTFFCLVFKEAKSFWELALSTSPCLALFQSQSSMEERGLQNKRRGKRKESSRWCLPAVLSETRASSGLSALSLLLRVSKVEK